MNPFAPFRFRRPAATLPLRRSALETALHRLARDERGLESVEYAVMIALIVVALVTAIGLLVAAINERFGAVASVIQSI